MAGGDDGGSRGGSGDNQSDQQMTQPEQDEQVEEEGQTLIIVRLILYGNTTKPVRVSATTTLAEMRR